MYDVEYLNGKWWLTKDGVFIKSIGGFIDPISPEIIKEAIEDEINME